MKCSNVRSKSKKFFTQNFVHFFFSTEDHVRGGMCMDYIQDSWAEYIPSTPRPVGKKLLVLYECLLWRLQGIFPVFHQ